MKEIYKRPVSANERLFVTADLISPPFVNQYILEGEGALDTDRWQKAVREASAANPGIRVALKGWGARSAWVDTGNSPPVREVDGSSWEGSGPEGAPFLYDRLDPFHGPSAEVVLVHGKSPRIIFRTLHAITDGRGQLFWMKDIFRALNGKDLIGSTSIITDAEMARQYTVGFRDAFPDEHITPAGKAEGCEKGVLWKRVTLKGKYPKMTAQVAILAAREAWRHRDGVVRFGVPVDMRLHDRKVKSTANLAGGITIEVHPDTTVDDVEKDILKKIQAKEDLKLYKGMDLYRHIPLWVLKRGYYTVMDKRHRRGLYNVSGYISNIGYVSLTAFQGGGFRATGFYPIPPFNELLPFFMGLATHGDPENGVYQEMVLTMPKLFATNGRFDTLIQHLQEGLKIEE